MATVIPVSDRFRDAIRFAVALQVPLTLFFAILLDGGQLAKVGGYAMIGFWAGVAVIMSRRPQTPSGSDLAYIRFAYVPLIVVAGVCGAVLHG